LARIHQLFAGIDRGELDNLSDYF